MGGQHGWAMPLTATAVAGLDEQVHTFFSFKFFDLEGIMGF